jgi:hypothetical protein
MFERFISSVVRQVSRLTSIRGYSTTIEKAAPSLVSLFEKRIKLEHEWNYFFSRTSVYFSTLLNPRDKSAMMSKRSFRNLFRLCSYMPIISNFSESALKWRIT